VNFHVIPDWISSENGGANIAVADLDNDGSPELIILRVDAPGIGANRGFYRIGKGLNAAGDVTNWGDWIEVPDWTSKKNQGGGIGVANFGSEGLGLIIFQVEHVEPGPNRGLYRVGRKLDAKGNVTDGWSNWIEVPDWISWRDQGAAIAVADINASGQADLVIFHIDDFHSDHPDRPNKAFYRVGFGLMSNATVAGWTDWMEVDWFSWFNQGAGVAVGDLDGNGRPEILIFQIDDPPQENAGYYRIGWGLDTIGRVTEGWGPWNKVDNWNAWENQGGGLAILSTNAGHTEAVIFQVDNPPAANAGLFSTVQIQTQIEAANTKGLWRLFPYRSEVLPVHAALLHTGRLLFFAGSGNNAARFGSPDFGNEGKSIFTSVVWDPTKNVLDDKTFDHPPTLRRADGTVIDFFCCGHAFLPDGRILVAGGSLKYPPDGFAGNREALIFDPVTTNWKSIQPMANGRWYPTVVTLADGSTLVFAGIIRPDVNDDTIERITTPDTDGWIKSRDFGLPLYPHLFEMSNGRLIFTGGKMDTAGDSVPFTFDPLNPTPSIVIADLQDPGQCNQCASVVMPPAQLQQFMILGGGPPDPDEPGQLQGDATNRVNVVDMTGDRRYHPKARLNRARMHVNAVLLPDRTILATGGAFTREASERKGKVNPDVGREVFEAEIYDPVLDTWTVTAPATVARLYHSVALLLPDGRVVAAGGNPDKGSQVSWLEPSPDPLEEMRLEIFSPPYLFQGPRPSITQVTQEIHYGEAVTIKSPDAANIKWVSLIRPGLTTHSFNGTQRLVDVTFTVVSSDALDASILNEPSIAPPGWYMLFLVARNGVPSVAKWVHLS
jgi:Domain of unknown function (DUF1929)